MEQDKNFDVRLKACIDKRIEEAGIWNIVLEACKDYDEYKAKKVAFMDSLNDVTLNKLQGIKPGTPAPAQPPNGFSDQQSPIAWTGNHISPEKWEPPVNGEEDHSDELFKDGIPDLSECPEAEKEAAINEMVAIAAKGLIGIFISFGLKTHMEQMLVNDPTDESFLLSFRKIGRAKPSDEEMRSTILAIGSSVLPVTQPASPAKAEQEGPLSPEDAFKNRFHISHDEPGANEQYQYFAQGFEDGLASLYKDEPVTTLTPYARDHGITDEVLQKLKSKASVWNDQILPHMLKGLFNGWCMGYRAGKATSPRAPEGLRWVKGEYERLYEQAKAGNRTICYVDYELFPGNPSRDICTLKALPEHLEFVSRGHGYASIWDNQTIDAFVRICQSLNVEWLESTPATQPDPVAFAEWAESKYWLIDGKWQTNPGEDDNELFTGKELLNIFLQQTKQQ